MHFHCKCADIVIERVYMGEWNGDTDNVKRTKDDIASGYTSVIGWLSTGFSGLLLSCGTF